MNRVVYLIICCSIVFVGGCAQTGDEQPTPNDNLSTTPTFTETVTPTVTPAFSSEPDEPETPSVEELMEDARKSYDWIEDIKGTVVFGNRPGLSLRTEAEKGKLSEEEKELDTRRAKFWLKKDNESYKYRIDFQGYGVNDSLNGTSISNGSLTLIYNTPMTGPQQFPYLENHSSLALVINETFEELNKSEANMELGGEQGEERVWSYAPAPDMYRWISWMGQMEFAGEEEVAGRECYFLEDKRENQTKGTYSRIWVDKKGYYPLKFEIGIIVDQEELKLSYTCYESVEINSGIDDSKFEFQIPEDIKTICNCKNRIAATMVNCTCGVGG